MGGPWRTARPDACIFYGFAGSFRFNRRIIAQGRKKTMKFRWMIAGVVITTAFLQIGGCVLHHDDDDIRMTIINDTNDDLAIYRDDNVWGWVYVFTVGDNDSRSLYFDDNDDGDDLRAYYGGTIVDTSDVLDGRTWTIN